MWYINPLLAELYYLHFHQLDVVPRYRDHNFRLAVKVLTLFTHRYYILMSRFYENYTLSTR